MKIRHTDGSIVTVSDEAVDSYLARLQIWNENNVVQVIVKSPIEMVCDFCGAKDTPLIANEAGFVEIEPGFESNDEWMSCLDCTPLILKNDRQALEKRGIDAYMQIMDNRKYVTTMVRQSHTAFWKVKK